MITDSADRQIGYWTYDLVAGEQAAIVVVKVTPDANRVLKSGSSAYFKVTGRRTGTADPFVDLATGIDLSGLPAGVPVSYDIRGEADGSATGLRRVGMFVGVTTGGQSGWAL